MLQFLCLDKNKAGWLNLQHGVLLETNLTSLATWLRKILQPTTHSTEKFPNCSTSRKKLWLSRSTQTMIRKRFQYSSADRKRQSSVVTWTSWPSECCQTEKTVRERTTSIFEDFHARSPAGYQFAKTILILPSVSTLNSKATPFRCDTIIDVKRLEILKERTKDLRCIQRIFQIEFDEIRNEKGPGAAFNQTT